VVALVHRYAIGFVEERALIEVPGELIDDNKVRAALRGLEGKLVDYRRGGAVPARDLAERLLEELEPHASELGCAAELEGARELINAGTGARRQLDLLEREGDIAALVRHLCRETIAS
jgi:glutamate---cysteine ligase / carboxylate-amine ligase